MCAKTKNSLLALFTTYADEKDKLPRGAWIDGDTALYVVDLHCVRPTTGARKALKKLDELNLDEKLHWELDEELQRNNEYIDISEHVRAHQ